MKEILTFFALLISTISFGQTAKEYFERGISKETKKDYKGAIKDFKKAIKEDENFAVAYFKKGDCEMALRNYDLAVEDFNNAIKIDSKYVEAYLKRAVSFISLRKYQEALLDLDKGIEADSTAKEIYTLRGLMREREGNKIGACEDFNKAKINGDAQAENCLQQYCSKSNEFEESLILNWTKQENWKIGSDQKQGILRIVDFIHSNETLKNWTELGHMTSMKLKKDVILDMNDVMKLTYEEIRQDAPKAKLTFIEKDKNTLYSWIIFKIESPRFINDRTPESQLWFIISDKQRLFTNFRAVKKYEISTEQQETWIKFFKNVKLVNQ